MAHILLETALPEKNEMDVETKGNIWKLMIKTLIV